MLRKAFDMFDREKRGCIHTNMVSTILRTLGQSFEEKELQALIKEIDADGKFHPTPSLVEQTLFIHDLKLTRTVPCLVAF